ncbi:hypothetical protein K504DRAFT_506932 [Pleomassaria siparia CBS 279.74]|uniref:DNA-directed RNA polymerase subunit n=1 Tax=Pleomassaria siparia CBS 279.74 TaxID=1314801 RepID=A0A6G1JV15_9PLEO|nr:hypothetical protein K504DRAFT_506932 [Pleomassaria siparia CBS 279.74]
MVPIQESDDYSLLHMERITQYVSLPPACLSNALTAVCASIFSPLILSYYPPARGIVLAYENVQLSDAPPANKDSRPTKKRKTKHYHEESDTEGQDSEDDATPKQLLLRIHNEYSAPFLWATASFLVWRPKVGAWIQGKVTQQASTHLTLSHLNSFPISILRQHLPDGWSWTSTYTNNRGGNGGGGADEGHWTNEDGLPIEDVLRIRIRDFEGRMDGKGHGRGGLKIDGSLVSEEVEESRKGEGEAEKRARREGRVNKGAMKTKEARTDTENEGEGDAIEVD